MLKDAPARGSDCASCAIDEDRRQFLRIAALSAAAAFAAVAGPRVLFAQPLEFTAPLRSGRTTHTYAIPASDGVQIDKDNEVILVRWQGGIYAFNLACPHQNTALKWDDKEHHFQCPKHHSRYEPDGTFIDGRATRGMDRFAITKSVGGVTVDLDKMYKQDSEDAAWKAAVVHV